MQQPQIGEMPSESEGLQVVKNHSFTRKNRGRRNEILDDEAKKLDDKFWQNNPLFDEEDIQINKADTHQPREPIENEDDDENDEIHKDNDIDEEGQDNNDELSGEENGEEEGEEDEEDDDEEYEDQIMGSDDMISLSDDEGI